jgi:1-acyl-sn-glycerol-3-phosphate acyltransferase
LVAFAELGVGGFILATTVIPLSTLFVRDERTRNRRAQNIIRSSFRLYILMQQMLGVFKLEVTGGEKLSVCRGKLIVANHPTLLDIVLLMALLPDVSCVAKSELWHNPFLRPVVRTAGYIRNDYEPEVLIEKCRDALRAGRNLIIFPEGTRSAPGKLLPFQRGFAHIATLAGVVIQPITITCEPIMLTKGRPSYRIPESRPCFRIEVGDEVDAKRFLDLSPESRARGARKLVSYMESDYRRRLLHV